MFHSIFASLSNSQRIFIVAILVGGVAALGTLATSIMLYEKYATQNWPAVDGTIEETFAQSEWAGKLRFRYVGYAKFNYAVNGIDYVSQRVQIGDGAQHREEEDALRDVAMYHPGDVVKVYYNPQDPKVGVLKVGYTVVDVLMPVGCLILAIGCGVTVLLVALHWLRSQQPVSDPTQPPPLPTGPTLSAGPSGPATA